MISLETHGLSASLRDEWLSKAQLSDRRRAAMVLHSPGDYHNRVYNFLLYDTYMQPHMHPGDEKREVIRLLSGSAAILFFDEFGEIVDQFLLSANGQAVIEVPAYTWHTYVMLSDKVVTYETMDGVYEPATWKSLASWAPIENSTEAGTYLKTLRASIK